MATNKKAVVTLVASLVVSILVVWGAIHWGMNKYNNMLADSNMSVVVAAGNLRAGNRLGPEALKVVDWPKSNPIEGTSAEPNLLINRVLVTNLSQGEPVLQRMLAPLGSKAGMSALIPQGMRAVSVHVTDVTDVAGFALPGNYVDVLVTTEDQNKNMISKIVLERVLVLAVAQESVVKDESKAKVVGSVTLQVTPDQAEQINVAGSLGTLSLVLRNQVDSDFVNTEGAKRSDLLEAFMPAKKSPPAVHKATGGYDTVEVIRGTSVSTIRENQ